MSSKSLLNAEGDQEVRNGVAVAAEHDRLVQREVDQRQRFGSMTFAQRF